MANASVLNSAVGRFLLGETNEGVTLLTLVRGEAPHSLNSVEETISLLRAHPAAMSELEARVERARTMLEEAREFRNGGKKVSESVEFSPEERFVLRGYAERELRLAESAGASDSAPMTIRFAEQRADSVAAARERFVRRANSAGGEPEVPVAETPGELAPAELRETARYGLKQWREDVLNWKEAGQCLRTRSAADSSRARIKDFAEQAAISGAVTTFGTVVHTGIAKFKPTRYFVDMFMSLVSTGVTMAMKQDGDTMFIRWVKVIAWGDKRTDIDAAVYQAWNPDHLADEVLRRTVEERREFNYSWNEKTSFTSPFMFRFLNGIECLAEAKLKGAEGARKALLKLDAGHFALKTSVSIGNSVAYYYARGKKTGQ
jgi:hypothetical protein